MPLPHGQLGDALFSPDGRYRWWLSRTWDADLPILGAIMLNPSVAGADRNDPTIDTLVRHATRWAFGSLLVANLLSTVETHPDRLLRDGHGDRAVGARTDEMLAWVMEQSDRVMAGWGSNWVHWPDRVQQVREMANERRMVLYCVGVNEDGQPRHPLYTSNKVELVEWGKQHLDREAVTTGLRGGRTGPIARLNEKREAGI